jgi:hypothetical protein
MGHLFISYSHKDKEYVHKLANALHANGFEVWIDDRIDYGTRWSSVLEDAIDRCDGFILVASENSRQSEWVQHEVARAKRLDKKFFPILLNGSPWLIFESTQYYEAQDGDLPGEKFIKALRLIEINRFEYYRLVAEKYWPVYRSDKYKFTIRYPGDGEISETESRVHIRLPKLPGTDHDTRELSIHFGTDQLLSDRLLNRLLTADQHRHVDFRYVDILGLTFLRELEHDGGMSRSHQHIIYTTARNSTVVTISFHIAVVDPGVYGHGPERTVRVDQEVEKELVMYSVCSFAWLD